MVELFSGVGRCLIFLFVIEEALLIVVMNNYMSQPSKVHLRFVKQVRLCGRYWCPYIILKSVIKKHSLCRIDRYGSEANRKVYGKFFPVGSRSSSDNLRAMISKQTEQIHSISDRLGP